MVQECMSLKISQKFLNKTTVRECVSLGFGLGRLEYILPPFDILSKIFWNVQKGLSNI